MVDLADTSNLVFAQDNDASMPKQSPGEIAAKAIASIKERQNWGEIEIRRAEKNVYTFALWYKAMPASMREVERDTKAIATSLLKELVDMGIDPSKDWISVFVHAYMKENKKSVTGKDQTRVFGRTMYDFNDDKLIFKPAN